MEFNVFMVITISALCLMIGFLVGCLMRSATFGDLEEEISKLKVEISKEKRLGLFYKNAYETSDNNTKTTKKSNGGN